jgi:iron complex transport system substrate-binding protein
MKKSILICVVLLALVYFLISGRFFFGPGMAPVKTDAPHREFLDMLGNRVQVPVPLNRVALFGGPTGQVAFILGVPDRICAVTNTIKMSGLIREQWPQIESLPGPRTVNGDINIEALIASGAQLVVAGSIDGQIVERKTRIPVAYLEDGMGEGRALLEREMHFYGEVFQRQERARQYIDFLEKTVALVRSRTKDIPPDKRVRVFNGYGPNHLVTLGGDTFMQERIDIAGCINCSEPVRTTGKRTGLHSGLGEVSMEQVIGWDPDIIVINDGAPEDMARHPQWRTIPAVRNHRVFLEPAGIFIFNRPTAESEVLYPLWLAIKAYPDRFKDISLKDEVRRFYREICGWSLTDEQVAAIISGAYENRMKMTWRY